MTRIWLKRSRKKRLEQGHPWVFKSEVERIEGEISAGDVIEICNHKGHFLAKGFANPHSQIVARILTYDPAERIDASFFARRVEDAWVYRRRFLPDTNACRVIYGEADFLPGLIVDKFGDVLVVQVLSYGMERHKGEIVEALCQCLQPRGIYERSDVPVRKLEGLELAQGILWGEVPEEVEIEENGLTVVVDVKEGQKTGYFLDQRENRAAIAPLMSGWGERHGIRKLPIGEDGEPLYDKQGQARQGVRPLLDDQGNPLWLPVDRRHKVVKNPFWDGADVLECFSHTGSFTLHACRYGARKVTCLDISEQAIAMARRNVQRNGFLHRVEFVVANAFDYLREQVEAGRQWDVVILDPPAFAKTKGALPGAYRGYKDINLHAMKLLPEGGFLVTASCSQPMTPDLFLQMIADAAFDAKKILRRVEFRSAGKDHPIIHGTESEYLKFAIFEVRSRK